jgi:hypothetical protein
VWISTDPPTPESFASAVPVTTIRGFEAGSEERQKAQSGAKMSKFRHFCSRLRFLPFLVFPL